MKKWFQFRWVLIFCFFSILSVFPQTKVHRSLNVVDGLVQSDVQAIYEDSKGYLWLGTHHGLSRWDGINFVNFQEYNGLAGSIISTIYEDRNGFIYFGTNNGISIYENGQFKNLHQRDGLINESVRAIYEDINGNLFFGTRRGLSVYRDGLFQSFIGQKKLENVNITVIHGNEDGTIFIGTYKNGIYIYENAQFTKLDKEKGLAHNNVTSIVEDDEGTLYIGTADGVSIYKEGRFDTLNEENGLSNNYVNTLCRGDDGTLYIGTVAGINLYQDGEFEFVNHSNGLTNDYVLSLFKGGDGTIYIGMSGGGVCIYNRGLLETLTEDVGLPDNIVYAISESSEGHMYFACGLGITVYRNGEFETFAKNTDLAKQRVRVIHKARDGKMYFGTGYQGVYIYDGHRFKQLNKKMGLIDDNISSIAEGRDGSIYFGAYRGLSIYKDGKIETLTAQDGTVINNVISIHESKNGSLYFGSYQNGITVYRDGQFHTLNESMGLSGHTLYSIHEDGDGTLYFGTDVGLWIYRDGQFKRYDIRHGLSSNMIMGILEDEEGKIYLSTYKGINILDFSEEEPSLRTILHEDGLAGDECNEGAYFKDSRGRMWFGMVGGATSYDPRYGKPNTKPPKVYITQIKLLEEIIPNFSFDKNRIFKHNENYFKFDFIGINLSAPKSVVYRYRMRGIDERWVETKEPSVQYANLNDGDYIFEVKAMNEWGYWSEAAFVSFTILAPFWETWWFVVLVILIVGGGITYFITYRFNNLLALERLRTKISADLHDNIGSGLTEICILSEVISKNLDNNATEIRKGLDKISDTSRSLVDSMSDIVWLVNPKRDSLYDLILRLKDSYGELLSYSDILFKTDNLKSLEKVTLPMMYRQNLFLIFKEGIHNSLKHSQCDEIFLDARITGKKLKLTLKDDGKGFETHQSFSGNGLDNMKRRAENIGGTLYIHSLQGEGTTIQFRGRVT